MGVGPSAQAQRVRQYGGLWLGSANSVSGRRCRWRCGRPPPAWGQPGRGVAAGTCRGYRTRCLKAMGRRTLSSMLDCCTPGRWPQGSCLVRPVKGRRLRRE